MLHITCHVSVSQNTHIYILCTPKLWEALPGAGGWSKGAQGEVEARVSDSEVGLGCLTAGA